MIRPSNLIEVADGLFEMSVVDITNKGSGVATIERPTVGRSPFEVNLFKNDENEGIPVVDRCYQFGSSSAGAIASAIGGDCVTNILDEISGVLKNNAIMQYVTSGIDAVNNAIDSVKSFGRQVIGSIINSPLGLNIRAFYCGVLAPSMQLLLSAIQSIISVPLTIINALHKTLSKIKEIANRLTSKLFGCIDSYVRGMRDGAGKMDVNFNFKVNDLFSFLDEVEKFLNNCEVISKPMVDLFNEFVNPCSPKTMRPLFNKIGLTVEDEDLRFCSSGDLVSFIGRRKKIQIVDTRDLNNLLNNFNPFNGLVDGTKLLTDLGNSYAQYGISRLHSMTIRRLHEEETKYNNWLRTRSRFLGQLVNNSIGWLFPDCGGSKFDGNRIKRKRYSVIDVVNILDSMNVCNSYICGSINNRVSELLAELELNRFGRWINPIVTFNDRMSSYISNALNDVFGYADEILGVRDRTGYVDIDFLKGVLPYTPTLSLVYQRVPIR